MIELQTLEVKHLLQKAIVKARQKCLKMLGSKVFSYPA